MSWTPLYAPRADGTFVIRKGEWDYHVTLDDPMYAEVQEALAALEVPLPDEPRLPVPVPNPEADLAAAVDALVESVAHSMQYKSAAQCRSYSNSTVAQYKAEADAFSLWQDNVWLTVFNIDRDNPPATVEAALALLPEFVRPTV